MKMTSETPVRSPFRRAVHSSRFTRGVGLQLRILAALCLIGAGFAPVVAHAQCATPTSITVTSGGSQTIDASSCGGTAGPSFVVVAPSHGYVTQDTTGTQITYTNNGDGATGDSFTWQDSSFIDHTVSVTITQPLSVTTSSLPNGTVGSAYSTTLSASGGSGSYSWSSTTLPAGLSLSSGGVISGTPTTAGTTSITFTVNDGSSSSTKTLSLTIYPPLSITTSSLPNGTVGSSYSATLGASGGTGSYSWSSTTLPAGLSLSSGGVISGTPTTAGTTSITFTVNDGTTSSTKTLSLTISAPTITLSPSTLPSATQNSAYSQTITASGGTSPYTYAVTSGSLPTGLSLSAGGVLSGTPATYGTFNFTVTATDSSGGSGPYTGSQSYSLTVTTATPVISPTSLPAATAGTAYSQTISASNGNPPYTFSVSAGSLPPGLSLSSSGILSGTPTASGSYTFTVQVTDSASATATRTYSGFTVNAPTITISPSALPNPQQEVAYSQQFSASGGSGGYTFSISSGSLPAGLSLSASGLLSGTPTVNGPFAFTVTAKDSNNSTGSQSYNVTVQQAPPVVSDSSVSMPANQSVTIAPNAASNSGPITSVSVTTAPKHGTASVSGTDIVYTPAHDFYGTDTLSYTATGPGGTSAPATVTITTHAVPVAASQTANTLAGATTRVDLTFGSQGGPFTKATLVSWSPKSAGSAQIAKSSSGAWQLGFTSTPTFSGTVTATFTLTNDYATSAPATVTITVAPRPDPTQDPTVRGGLQAQVDATRRFALGQIDNFEQRLEALHGGGGSGGFQNHLNFHSNDIVRSSGLGLFASNAREKRRRAHSRQLNAAARPSAKSRLPDGYTFWTDGTINFGSRRLSDSTGGFDFDTSGITAGVDKRFTPSFAFGIGLGYGHGHSNLANNGGRVGTDSYSLAGYASYSPSAATFLDGLLGYQRLNFDTQRYVAADNGTVGGHRRGTQWFGALSGGYAWRSAAWLLSPYGRLDLASARLGAYVERNDPLYALGYRNEAVRTDTASVGLRAAYTFKRSDRTVVPEVRIEYGHDLEGSSLAAMGYADMSYGALYTTRLAPLSRNHALISVGAQWQYTTGLAMHLQLQDQISYGNRDNRSIMLGIQRAF